MQTSFKKTFFTKYGRNGVPPTLLFASFLVLKFQKVDKNHPLFDNMWAVQIIIYHLSELHKINETVVILVKHSEGFFQVLTCHKFLAA